jgi:hypothetical protein
MTLHLVTAASSSDLALRVDGAGDRPMPFLAQIDEEIVNVVGGAARVHATPYPAPTAQWWQVERGAAGTIPASHAAGADVVPVTVAVQTAAPTAPPPATAGAAQQVTLIGPVAVTHATAGILDGAAVLDVPAGSSLIRAFAILRTAFDREDAGDVAQQHLRLRAGDTAPNASDLTIYLASNGVYSWGRADPYQMELALVADPSNGYFGYDLSAFFHDAGHIYAQIDYAATVGEADIYAIVASAA